MHPDDLAHHLRVGKGDVVEVAAAEKRVAQVLLGIGGDDDHRPVPGADRFVDLDDVELHLVENVEHVVLEIGVGLVDLVDEQHGALIGHEGLADLAHLDVVLDVAHVAAGIAEAAVVEPGEGVVLVQGVHQLHARFDVEHDQRHFQGLGDGVGQHGLAGARLPLEQQGHFQGHGDVDDPGQLVVEHITGSAGEFGLGGCHGKSSIFKFVLLFPHFFD